ncbi:hypothetical protein [Kitasatospora herbaricolor]|uniref:hypothetical protein n=1 Tax=Kitasatospora herbaricolor TaxID=68217 RepID=UPI0036DA84EF
MRGARSIHTLSFAALYIEARHRSRGGADGTLLGPATGFLMGFPGSYWLITARHVLSGRRSDNGAIMSKTGLCPDYLRVRFAGETAVGLEPLQEEYDLYDGEGDYQEVPLWRAPEEQRIDVAALHIGHLPETVVEAPMPNVWPTLRELWPADRRSQQGSDQDVDIPLGITDRLFVLGFPFGNTGSWPYAVWTAAPVASEPLAGWDGLPGFLLDSRTREGQSGAPVVLQLGPADPVVVGEGTIMHEESVTGLVGIYSGRIDPRSDLGMVWTTDALFAFLPEVAPPDWTPGPELPAQLHPLTE